MLSPGGILSLLRVYITIPMICPQSTDDLLVEPILEIQALTRDTHEITVNWTLIDPNKTVENRWRITVEDLALAEYIAWYEGAFSK